MREERCLGVLGQAVPSCVGANDCNARKISFWLGSAQHAGFVKFDRKSAGLPGALQANFDWTEVIRLGHADIDEQHDQMFLLADALVECLVDTGAITFERHPLKLLQSFIDFSFQHFQFEEALMRSAGYPETEPHAKRHNALLAEIANQRYAFEQGHFDAAQVTDFLRNWIVRHIDEADRKLVAWIRSGQSPGAG
jgi:hemerythrin